MLRLLAGGALIDRGIAAAVTGESHTGLFVLQMLAAATGFLIAGGLWTPVVGLVAGTVEVCIALTQPGAQPLAIMLAGMGVSLAMIGPGAWSIDARLYGRKQLLPPEP